MESESTQGSFAEDSAAEGQAETSGVMETSCDDSKDIIEEDEEEDEEPDQDNADQADDDGQDLDEGRRNGQTRERTAAEDEQEAEDSDSDEEDAELEPQKQKTSRRSLKERPNGAEDYDEAEDGEQDEDAAEDDGPEDSKDGLIVVSRQEGIVEEPDDEKPGKIQIKIKMVSQDSRGGVASSTAQVVDPKRKLDEAGGAGSAGSSTKSNGASVNGSRPEPQAGAVANSILSSVKTRNRVKRRYDENLVDIDDPTFVEAAGGTQKGTLRGSTASESVASVDNSEEYGQPARPSRSQQSSPPDQSSALVPYYSQEAAIAPTNYKIEHLVGIAVFAAFVLAVDRRPLSVGAVTGPRSRVETRERR